MNLDSVIISKVKSAISQYTTSLEINGESLGGGIRNQINLENSYTSALPQLTGFSHSEPWLTLMAMYGLFGHDPETVSGSTLTVINDLFATMYGNRNSIGNEPIFNNIKGVYLEPFLPEIQKYREAMKEIFCKESFHPYSDRKGIIENKLKAKNCSLEGNTHQDALIIGRDQNNIEKLVFIEAKFLSDISYHISYMPVRNQIARNIDCAIDIVTKGGKELSGIENFWFILLTPGMFRTKGYGGQPRNTPIDKHQPDRSRLFCYKMDDYLDPQKLKQDLPHWDGTLNDNHWEVISSHIGWLAFEEIVSSVVSNNLLLQPDKDEFIEFFKDREIV